MENQTSQELERKRKSAATHTHTHTHTHITPHFLKPPIPQRLRLVKVGNSDIEQSVFFGPRPRQIEMQPDLVKRCVPASMTWQS
jgi:hypothetical protein